MKLLTSAVMAVLIGCSSVAANEFQNELEALALG